MRSTQGRRSAKPATDERGGRPLGEGEVRYSSGRTEGSLHAAVGSFGVACVLHWGLGTVRHARRVGTCRIACGAGACGDRLDGSYRDLKPSEFVGEAEGSNRRESSRGQGCCRCCWAGRESLTHAEHERMASHACALAFFWTKRRGIRIRFLVLWVLSLAARVGIGAMEYLELARSPML